MVLVVEMVVAVVRMVVVVAVNVDFEFGGDNVVGDNDCVGDVRATSRRPPPRPTPVSSTRLEAHPEGATLPYAAAAQRARLAALNALAVAPLGQDGDTIAAVFPHEGARRTLDASGQPAGVRTAAVLEREAVRVAAAIDLAEEEGGGLGGGGVLAVVEG